MDDEDMIGVEVYKKRREHWKKGIETKEKEKKKTKKTKQKQKQKEEHWEKKVNNITFYANLVSSGQLVESLILIYFLVLTLSFLVPFLAPPITLSGLGPQIVLVLTSIIAFWQKCKTHINHSINLTRIYFWPLTSIFCSIESSKF